MQVNILDGKADSGFYRVLLKLLVMCVAIGCQGYSVLLAWLYLGFGFAGLRVQQSRVCTRHNIGLKDFQVFGRIFKFPSKVSEYEISRNAKTVGRVSAVHQKGKVGIASFSARSPTNFNCIRKSCLPPEKHKRTHIRLLLC